MEKEYYLDLKEIENFLFSYTKKGRNFDKKSTTNQNRNLTNHGKPQDEL